MRHTCPPWLAVFLWLIVFAVDDGLAQTRSASTSIFDLKKLSVEQLMEVEVTSASRSEEALAAVPAALVVVTSEDIRRSGATSVPEALRLLPGVHVARQSSSTWAVSARGFSSLNSEKLLVMSDTRSMYTPLFSGVFWDVQNYVLQDIERIEVIRGPGATLWGSNAVNGVVNITTKSARDTQGLYVMAMTGSEERATAAIRYGGQLSATGHYRVFAKFADRDGTFHPGIDHDDGWRMGHGGIRADWETSSTDTLTLQAEAYGGEIGQLTPSLSVSGRPGPAGPLRVDAAGGNVLARWRRRTAGGSDLQVRAYYDGTHRDDPTYVDDLDTFDLDVQHRLPLASAHEVTWGANYRLTSSDVGGKGIASLEPPLSRDTVVSGFVQDQMRLHESVHLSLGTKLEHNEFSGLEAQPSARLAWNPAASRTLWGAVSRAVRVPTRFERDIFADGTVPGEPTVQLVGNPEFDSERLMAYEVGYRWQVHPTLFLDVAAFENRYDGLASLEPDVPVLESIANQMPIVVRYRNLMNGRARGLEALATFAPVPWWRLSATSSWLDLRLEPEGSDLNNGRFSEGSTPSHQLGVRSYVDLPRGVQVDAMFRRLTSVQSLLFTGPTTELPGYGELDLRVAWRGWEQTELSVVGTNLLHSSHAEFGLPQQRGEVERAVYLRVAWGF